MIRIILNKIGFVISEIGEIFNKGLVGIFYTFNLYQEEQTRNGQIIRPHLRLLIPLQRRELEEIGYLEHTLKGSIILLLSVIGVFIAFEIRDLARRILAKGIESNERILRQFGHKQIYRKGNRVFEYRAPSDLNAQLLKWDKEDKERAEQKRQKEQERRDTLRNEQEAFRHKQNELLHKRKIKGQEKREASEIHALEIKAQEPKDVLILKIIKLKNEIEFSKEKLQKISENFRKFKSNDLNKLKETIIKIQRLRCLDRTDRLKCVRNIEAQEELHAAGEKFDNSSFRRRQKPLLNDKTSRELAKISKDYLTILPGKFVGDNFILHTDRIGEETLPALIRRVKHLLKNISFYERKFNKVSKKLSSSNEFTLDAFQNLESELNNIADEFHGRLKSLMTIQNALFDMNNNVLSQYKNFREILLISYQKLEEEKEDAELKVDRDLALTSKSTKAILKKMKNEKRQEERNKRLENMRMIQKMVRTLAQGHSLNYGSQDLSEGKVKSDVTIRQELLRGNQSKAKKEDSGPKQNIFSKFEKITKSFYVGPYSTNLTNNVVPEAKDRSERRAQISQNARYVNAIEEVEVYLRDMQMILENLGISIADGNNRISDCAETTAKTEMADTADTVCSLNNALTAVSPATELFYIKAEIYCLIYLTSSIMEKIKKGPLRSVFPEHIPRQFRDAIYHNPSFRESFEKEDQSQPNRINSNKINGEDKGNEIKENKEKANDLLAHHIIQMKIFQDKMRHIALELLTYFRKFFNYYSDVKEMELEAAKLTSLILRGNDHGLLKQGHIKNDIKTCKRKMREAISFLHELDIKGMSNEKRLLIQNELQAYRFSSPLQSLVLAYTDDAFGVAKSNGQENWMQIVLNGSFALSVGELGAYFTEYCQRLRDRSVQETKKDRAQEKKNDAAQGTKNKAAQETKNDSAHENEGTALKRRSPHRDRRDRDFPMFKREIAKYDLALSNQLRHAEVSLEALTAAPILPLLLE